MLLRWLRGLIGAWLVMAAMILPFLDDRARMNDSLVGFVTAALAVSGAKFGWRRKVQGALAVWLAVAPWALRYKSTGAVLHDVLVGLVLFVLSLLPPVRERVSEGPFAPPRRGG
ncbi:MAG: SPW repeat protein [Myxococcales bacterium]|nr:SPW repeat protein [Myxococcales bacterium]